jgi:hypothetical protein
MSPETEVNPEETKAEAPVFVFPSLENGPAVVYENERHEVWVGIPFSKVPDPNMVTATLDRAKYEALMYLSSFHQAMAARQKLQVSPVGKRVQNSLSNLFAKGKSLIS